MEESILTQATGLTPQQQLYLTWGTMLVGLFGKLLGSIRSGGGLRRILLGVWLGDTVPKVIAQDYSEELKIKPPAP